MAAADIDLLNRIADLSSPALLVLFIVLLQRGNLVWRRELERERRETEAWRQAAIGRALDHDRAASIAEDAIKAAGGAPR